MKVREPVVAGAFYPRNPDTLKGMIGDFLDSVPKTKAKAKILGLIVPHAGYEYSGQTAAYAYKELEGENYKTAIIIGPSHQVPFSGISIYPKGYYETPLGKVEVDEKLSTAISSKSSAIRFVSDAHAAEHSLEVQVPFLQSVLKNFKIVPIVMGDQTMETCKVLANAIAGAVQDKAVIIVASSDFYHGYSYSECVGELRHATDLISNFNINGFYNSFWEKERARICIACGGGPITTCLLACEELGAKNAALLHSTNSGDVTGRKSGYVVGYASFAISGDGSNETVLNIDEKRHLISIAKQSIAKAVKGEPIPRFESKFTKFEEKGGCFVTIKKNRRLRGCIGYIQPIKPLYKAVSEMAVAAALKDPRFPPVREGELPSLEIEITCLSPLKRIKSTDEIKVGRDGLYIVKGFYSGLLLPQVATEEGWNKTTFLEHTCMKAGLPTNAWKESDTEIYTFTGEIINEQDL
jgi:AmmeMemoRadiSam system protein B/AmmeMemoRadiSam system protein A